MIAEHYEVLFLQHRRKLGDQFTDLLWSEYVSYAIKLGYDGRDTHHAQHQAMRLNFPNPSRSFDVSNRRVCFWGYDSAIEISFFVEEDALRLLYPEKLNAEESILDVFDAVRDEIHRVANKVYVRGDQKCHAYTLATSDF